MTERERMLQPIFNNRSIGRLLDRLDDLIVVTRQTNRGSFDNHGIESVPHFETVFMKPGDKGYAA